MKVLTVIEKEGQRVLTTQQLAECYGTITDTIMRNFQRNKSKYTEGVHYFVLTGEALKEFKGSRQIVTNLKYAPILYLWTEAGALHHAKSLGTKSAWKVFQKLEESYFNARKKEETGESSGSKAEAESIEDVLIKTLEQMKEMKERIQSNADETEAVKSDVQGIRDTILIDPFDWRTATDNIISTVSKKLGDMEGPRLYVYRTLEKRARCRLNTRLKNLRNKALSNGFSLKRANEFSRLDVISGDSKLREIYISIVKELGIKHNLNMKDFCMEQNG